MPVNTLEEEGASLGPYLTDPARLDAYAEQTDRYLTACCVATRPAPTDPRGPSRVGDAAED